MTVKIAIIGASGRVGRLITEVLSEYPGIELVAAVVSENSVVRGTVCRGGVLFEAEMDRAVSSADVVVDFSTPEVSVEACRSAARHGKPILVGTTGHTNDQQRSLKDCATKIPLLVAPNTSLGIFALRYLSLRAARLLGEEFDIEIAETHHRLKKDAPSGTAVMLADALCAETRSVQSRDRASAPSLRRDDEIGIASFRGGDVPGEHVVSFHGRGETLELVHRVRDRKIFARGALRLALLLPGRAPGFLALESFFAASPA